MEEVKGGRNSITKERKREREREKEIFKEMK